jgi:ankyrin repeat protein
MNSEALLESKESATGGTVDSSRNNQHPPLWLAAKNGKEDEVAELVFSTSEWRKTMKDPDGRTALWWAVSTGQARIAELLLATQAFDVNEIPDHHHGLLHQAVRSNYIAVTKALLDHGALDVNIKDTSGLDNPSKQTSLHLATDRGLKEIVKLLLSHPDINVSPQDETGETPLHTAARKDYMEILVLLLAHPGMDVNSQDSSGRTLLHAAATQGYTEILMLLLARPDVDVNSRDVVGDTPLHKAARKGHMEILVLLLARADIDLAPRNGYRSTPLYLAAENGHEGLVDVLLDTPESEAMLDIGQDLKRGSPLHAAAGNGHKRVVKLLLARNGTGPGLRNSDGETPLHLAAGRGYKGVVDELLATSDSKDMVNLQDKEGETPLHRAALGGYEDCVIALMDCADVNVQGRYLRTPLHSAVQQRHDKVVENLLKTPGILIHALDENRCTPLHLALRMGHESIARQLLKGSGFGETPKGTYGRALLSCATQTGNALMLNLLLERLKPSDTGDINALDKNGQTLLWSAAKRQDIDVMELLITKDEVTLCLLVQRGEASLVRVLLKAGYNVDIRDNLGRSALHIATILGHFDIAKSLVSFGASVDCKDGRGNTALRLAIQRKRCNFIDMLLESSADITGVRTDEWLDAYGRKLPDAVHLEEKPSGKKTIRFIEAAVIPDIIRQMHNVPKTERRSM